SAPPRIAYVGRGGMGGGADARATMHGRTWAPPPTASDRAGGGCRASPRRGALAAGRHGQDVDHIPTAAARRREASVAGLAGESAQQDKKGLRVIPRGMACAESSSATDLARGASDRARREDPGRNARSEERRVGK